ncbi:MAG: AMP-dependent synthetase/ligase [Candidatus Kapaibacterium sp.]
MNLNTSQNPSSETLLDPFLRHTTGALKDRAYLRYKRVHGEPYRDMSFAEFGERTREAFAGFARLGIQRGDRIAIISESRPEWLIAEFAALALGAVWVPMFPTLMPPQIEFIVNDCGAKMLIVSNDLQFSKARKIEQQCLSLETIVVLNDETDLGAEHDKKILHLGNLSTQPTTSIPSTSFEEEAKKARPEGTVTIIYTSGTTGNPKGVMLTHRNIMANIEGALAAIPPLTEADIALSFLPLCHAFEHVASHFFFYRAMTVAFAESSETVADNLLEIRPTIMTGVPRFYERVHSRIMRMREKLTPMKRNLFDWALRVGAKNGLAFEGKPVPFAAKVLKPIADLLVLGKIRARTGGRIRFFVSGAAALSPEVGRAFAAFGLPIIEGYGLTEAAPVLTANPYTKLKWGTVGKPLFNVEIKIAEDGEILARGPNIMQGYYQQPEATREMIDAESWLHTGDIGELDEEGYLKITDRKKHIFISTGGKNIAPAPVESLLGESRFIEQIMLVGDKRPFCTALIVPDAAALREAHIGPGGTILTEEFARNEAVRAAIEMELERLQTGLASYERARRFTLLSEPFTIENGMMTPTLKIRRKAVEERYRDRIEAMYQVRPVEERSTTPEAA